MHYLSSIYFVTQPLPVSGMFIAHQQEVFILYVQQLVRVIGLSWLAAGRVRMEQLHPIPASSHSTETYNTFQLLYVYSESLLMMANKPARNM
jgi:hypothetical protein